MLRTTKQDMINHMMPGNSSISTGIFIKPCCMNMIASGILNNQCDIQNSGIFILLNIFTLLSIYKLHLYRSYVQIYNYYPRHTRSCLLFLPTFRSPCTDIFIDNSIPCIIYEHKTDKWYNHCQYHYPSKRNSETFIMICLIIHLSYLSTLS